MGKGGGDNQKKQTGVSLNTTYDGEDNLTTVAKNCAGMFIGALGVRALGWLINRIFKTKDGESEGGGGGGSMRPDEMVRAIGTEAKNKGGGFAKYAITTVAREGDMSFEEKDGKLIIDLQKQS